jgi:hypothetical protein
MNKQLKQIQRVNVSSEDELNNLLNEDFTNCCPRKKRKSIVKPVAPAPVKRSMNGYVQQPPIKRQAMQIPQRPQQKQTSQQVYRAIPASVRPVQPKITTSKNNSIICTPDILGLLDDSIPTTNMMPSSSVAPPPPLVMRNNQPSIMRNNQRPVQSGPAPIYHNVNGFQIDLNHAARQEIFR